MQAFISHIEPCSREIWKGKNPIVIYFAGCNYNCPFCNAPDNHFSKEEFIQDIKDIKKQIKDYSQSSDAVFFSGGEPCLQRQVLLAISNFCKDIGLKTGLATNGSKPGCIRSLLELGLLDTIAVDLKSPLDEELFQKVTRSSTFFISKSDLVNDFKKTLDILKRYEKQIDIEFRTTIVPGLMYKKEDMISMGELIDNIESRWILQRFMPENIKSRSYSDLNPPSVGFLENLKESLQKRYPQLRIELS
ncbi:radical SAM protein [Candidatus Woesearchaeota archaeon]|nr:radical SAM protein [Candidatus Woesearchaeota archaeon]